MIKKILMDLYTHNTNYITICISKFLVAFSNFVITYLTFFLVNYRGVNEGLAGVIVTLVAFSYIPATLIGGKMRLLYIKKKLILFFAIAGCCYFSVPFIENIGVQIILIIIGKFVITLTEPIMMAIVNQSKETTIGKKNVFSTLYLVTNIGFAIGPVVAGSLYQHGIYLIFGLDGVLKILVAVIFLFLYKESEPIRVEQKEEPPKSYRTIIIGFPILLVFSILVLVINWVYSQADFTVPLLFNKIFINDGVKFFSYAMSINAAVVIIFTKAINRITIKWKAYNSVLVSGLFFALAYWGYSNYTNLLLLMACTFVWSIGEILFFTNMSICVNEIVGTSNFSQAYALVNTITRIASIFNPMLIGVLLNFMNISAILFVIACITFAIVVIYGLNGRKFYAQIYDETKTDRC